MKIVSDFNNREIAIIIWLALSVILALANSKIRDSLFNLLKAFFEKKIQILFMALLAYVSITILILQIIKIWELSALKDTVFWFLGTALTTFLNMNKALHDDDFFKKVVLDNAKFAIILEFVINLYTFSLPIELIMMPVLVFLALMSSFLETKPEYRQVKSLTDIILAIIGILLISFTFYGIVSDIHGFASLKNLRDFILPPLLSVLLIPYLYLTALFMQYEHFFMLISFANKDKFISRSVKKKVLRTCHINLPKLIKISKKASYPKINHIEEMSEWFSE